MQQWRGRRMGLLSPQQTPSVSVCGWMNAKSCSDDYKSRSPNFQRVHARAPRAGAVTWVKIASDRRFRRTCGLNNGGVNVIWCPSLTSDHLSLHQQGWTAETVTVLTVQANNNRTIVVLWGSADAHRQVELGWRQKCSWLSGCVSGLTP